MNDRIPAEALPIATPQRGWRFASFAFDLVRGELVGPDGPVTLRPKADLLLREFLARPGRLLGREELMDALWPATVVTDDSLVQVVGELRVALGDREQRLIRTVPRRGYRFEAAAVAIEATIEFAAPESGSPPEPPIGALPVPSARRRLMAIVLAVTLVAVAVTSVWRTTMAPEPAMSLDDAVTARHVYAVMPMSADDASMRAVAAQVGDGIASQIATRPGCRVIGRSKTAGFDEAGPALDRLANELHATYAITGRVRPAAAGASLEVHLLTVPDGVSLGSARFEVDTGAAAPTVAEVGQLVANFVRGKVGENEYRRATAPGRAVDAADLLTIGWEEIGRMAGPEDIVRARANFREALRRDPQSLLALTGLNASFVSGKSMRLPLSADESAEFEHALDRMMKLATNDSTPAMLWADLKLQEGRPDLAIPRSRKRCA